MEVPRRIPLAAPEQPPKKDPTSGALQTLQTWDKRCKPTMQTQRHHTFLHQPWVIFLVWLDINLAEHGMRDTYWCSSWRPVPEVGQNSRPYRIACVILAVA